MKGQRQTSTAQSRANPHCLSTQQPRLLLSFRRKNKNKSSNNSESKGRKQILTQQTPQLLSHPRCTFSSFVRGSLRRCIIQRTCLLISGVIPCLSRNLYGQHPCYYGQHPTAPLLASAMNGGCLSRGGHRLDTLSTHSQGILAVTEQGTWPGISLASARLQKEEQP